MALRSCTLLRRLLASMSAFSNRIIALAPFSAFRKRLPSLSACKHCLDSSDSSSSSMEYIDADSEAAGSAAGAGGAAATATAAARDVSSAAGSSVEAVAPPGGT